MACGCIAIHHCIAAWGRLGKCIAIEELYYNLGGWMAGACVTIHCSVL